MCAVALTHLHSHRQQQLCLQSSYQAVCDEDKREKPRIVRNHACIKHTKAANHIDINSSMRTDLVSFKKKLQSPKVVVCEGSTTRRGDSLLIEHLPVNPNLQRGRIWRSIMPLTYP